MVLSTIFEMVGAITVGARTADTIKNGIIPNEVFDGNAGVQMLAFTCALAGASIWVMWCTRHSAHVSSTYSLISSVAGVGVATAGARNVQWGWNGGKGLGAIFAGLGMAPAIAAGFAATVFMLIKLVVHMRTNPIPWSVWTSPFFFLIAGTICTISIVYKGSPNLKLNNKSPAFIAGVSLGTGAAIAILAIVFFVPFLYMRVVRRDNSIRWYHVFQGPLLLKRTPSSAELARVPNYAVEQHEEDDINSTRAPSTIDEKGAVSPQVLATDTQHPAVDYKAAQLAARERLHGKLRAGRGPLAWAMRYLHSNKQIAGEIYEKQNIVITLKRIPAQLVVGALYGMHYDIHAAQSGIAGTPEGIRMARVYAHATKYPNEVEHAYSFVQILTACTASFAHGANDVGNAVAPWAVIYSAWRTGDAAASKLPVPLWQIAVLAATISIGFITYGYNIMKVMGNKITYHSPSRGCSMELGAAITVLVFSQYKLPVSTSMCITGATIGVGLCNGTYKAVNWQRVGLLVVSWIMTIPIAGLIGGLLMGITLNTPHFS